MVALAASGTPTADATPVPPIAAPGLVGTWATDETAGINRLVIEPAAGGTVTVDAFRPCAGQACELGRVRALIYKDPGAVDGGAYFQTRQALRTGTSVTSRLTIFGHVTNPRGGGGEMFVRTLESVLDGAGRHNVFRRRVFRPTTTSTSTASGEIVAAYRRGSPPALRRDALRTWPNHDPTRSISRIGITGTRARPLVTVYHRCGRRECAWPRVAATTYGPSAVSLTGDVLLASIRLADSRTQLILAVGSRTMIVQRFTEYTDGSGRSNFSVQLTFDRT